MRVFRLDDVTAHERDPFKYARSGDVAIAYRVLGDGPRDVVFVHGFAGNIEIQAENPHVRALYESIAAFSRFITFDRRGTGLSDRLREAATLETRMDDLRAVLDAVESERAVLVGTFEAASMCILFAATYPERTLGLALYNPVARGAWAPDYPWAPTLDEWRRENLDDFLRNWGTYELAASWVSSTWLRHSPITSSSSPVSLGSGASPQAPARSSRSGGWRQTSTCVMSLRPSEFRP